MLAGDSAGGGLRAGAGARAARPRRPAADPPAAARAVGRPDDQHPGHRRGRRRRPVAVPRQAPRVRRVVGRVGRRPRPARGQPGAGRPGRAAAGADVLRHPRHPGARLPAARAAGGRGGLGPHLRRGARPDPRLPAAAVRPRGAAGVAADAGVPAHEHRRAARSTARRPRRLRRVAAAAAGLRGRAGSAPTRTSTGATRSRGPGTSCSARRRTAGYPRLLDDGTCGGSAGWCSPPTRAAAAWRTT